MSDKPKVVNPVIGLIVAVVFASLGWKLNLPEWARFSLTMAGIFIGVASVFGMVDWIVYLTTARLQRFRYALVADTVTLANSLKGLTTGQLEFVKSRSILEINGISGDSGIFWWVRFPGGDVELEFVAEFLRASLECPAGYLWPVRDHTSTHWTAWKDFVNVEEKLRVVTDGLIYFGYAEKASGRYSAKLAPGVTFEVLADYFRVEL